VYLGVIRSRSTTYSKFTIQHNHLNRKNVIQNQKYKCKNNIKLIYLLYTVRVNLKNINSLSLIKSINNLMHMNSIKNVKIIIELSVINNIPPRLLYHPDFIDKNCSLYRSF